MSLVNEYFVPAKPWVTGNLQTIASRIAPKTYDLITAGSEERFIARLADGEALALRVHRPWRSGGIRPLVLLVHGMGGTVDSDYIRATTLGLLRGGYTVARVDQRGAGDSKEHGTTLYHGGRTDDLRDVLRSLAELDDIDGVVVSGWSLGGNMTLKLMGEDPEGLPIRAATSVCAPLNLLNDVEHIGRRMGGVYERYLMRGLRQDTLASNLELTDGEREQVMKARTIPQFDTLITARRNGWRDAAEYYRVNSSQQFLPHIIRPTLVIHAMDDPMIPSTAYAEVDWDELARTTPVRRAIVPYGGHCGFHEEGAELPWFVGRIQRFYDEVCPPDEPGERT